MNKKENFVSTILCEKSNHMPIYLFDVTLGMELAGYDTDSLYVNGFDAERSARSLLALQKHLDTDAVNGSVSWMDTRLLGNKVVFPKKGIPYISEYALSDPTKLYSRDPTDVCGKELNEIVRSHVLVSKGTDAAMVNHVPSPLGVASSLRGLEPLLMDMLTEPDYVHDLLNFSSNITNIVSERIFSEIIPDTCLISGAYDNVDIVGEESLEKFSLNYVKKTIDLIQRFDIPVCFHPHGILSDNLVVLKKICDLGIDCLYYGEYNDAVTISNNVDKISLMGGVDTFTTIMIGDDERVEKDTRGCVERMNGNYVFSCSCSVDRGLPLNKIELMVDTARKYSKHER